MTFEWRDAVNKDNTVEDSHGNVLIIGGDTEGPFGSGGSATWRVEIENSMITKVSAKIYTNGEKFWGKGAHSTPTVGVIELWLGSVMVGKIECNTLGWEDDYWPMNAPAGTASISTNWASNLSSDATIEFKVEAGPNTVIDVNRIELRLEY